MTSWSAVPVLQSSFRLWRRELRRADDERGRHCQVWSWSPAWHCQVAMTRIIRMMGLLWLSWTLSCAAFLVLIICWKTDLKFSIQKICRARNHCKFVNLENVKKIWAKNPDWFEAMRKFLILTFFNLSPNWFVENIYIDDSFCAKYLFHLLEFNSLILFVAGWSRNWTMPGSRERSESQLLWFF